MALVRAILISALCVLTVACGDSGNDFVSTNNTNTGVVGNFLGSATVGNNQASTLNVTSNTNGTIAGNFLINAPTPQAIAAGTYPVSGTVDLSTGAFTVTGTIPGIGNFTITGTLPSGNNQGSYQVTLNNQTFQGTIQNSSLGQPTAPNNNNNNGNSSVIQSGTLSNFVFNPDGNYNGVNPPVSANSLIAGAVATGTNGSESATFVLTDTVVNAQTVRIRSFVVSIVAPPGESLVTGQTYQLASSPTSNGAVIALSTSEGTTVIDGWSLVQATTGQATITARDTNSITMNFQFNNVGPNSEVANNPSTGTFSTSGTLVGNFGTNI